MSAYVVKKGKDYVAWPDVTHTPYPKTEWTQVQQYAWRWCGLESGNGARLFARKVAGRVVRLVPRKGA